METISIDCEPLWTDLAPLFCEWLEDGTDEQKDLARSEIQKMAVAAAHLRAQQKFAGHKIPHLPQPAEE